MCGLNAHVLAGICHKCQTGGLSRRIERHSHCLAQCDGRDEIAGIAEGKSEIARVRVRLVDGNRIRSGNGQIVARQISIQLTALPGADRRIVGGVDNQVTTTSRLTGAGDINTFLLPGLRVEEKHGDCASHQTGDRAGTRK